MYHIELFFLQFFRSYPILIWVITMFYIDVSRPPVFSNFGRFVQEKEWEHNGRTMEVNLLVVVLSGQAVFRYGGVGYPVRRGDCVVIPKGNFYTASTDSFCEYYYAHFSGELFEGGEEEAAFDSLNGRREDLEALAEEPARWLCLPPCQALGNRLEDAIELLCPCDLLRAASDYRSALLLENRLTQLLIALSSFPAEGGGRMPELMERILRFIDDHYTEPISLERLSKTFFVSKEYIARLFRRHLSTTSSKYVHFVKIRYAKMMLTEQDATLSQIAERLGFCDAFYFSKVFKQVEGVSPQAFLRERR